MTHINETLLHLMAWHEAHLRDEEGQGLTEYGLILALVAIACVAALGTLSGGIKNTLSSVAGKMSGG
jgi:pilus assembly protein Flp/PilA